MTEILGLIGTGITVIGFIYAIMRNFKTDVNARIDKLEIRMDMLDERMFLLSTGKTLAEAIKEDHVKKMEKTKKTEK